jgi:hypothetical protein
MARDQVRRVEKMKESHVDQAEYGNSDCAKSHKRAIAMLKYRWNIRGSSELTHPPSCQWRRTNRHQRRPSCRSGRYYHNRSCLHYRWPGKRYLNHSCENHQVHYRNLGRPGPLPTMGLLHEALRSQARVPGRAVHR